MNDRPPTPETTRQITWGEAILAAIIALPAGIALAYWIGLL